MIWPIRWPRCRHSRSRGNDRVDMSKLRGWMGLCVRAHQAVFGEDGCLRCVRGGECGVLLLDAGASSATRARYTSVCERNGVPLGVLPEGLLHSATGKPGVAMAIRTGGLAEQIVRLLPCTGAEEEPMKSANNCGGASVE